MLCKQSLESQCKLGTFPRHCPPVNISIDGNPDIAGIGVIASFGLTATITLFFAVPVMLISMIKISTSEARFAFLAPFVKLSNFSQRQRFVKRFEECLEGLVIGLSDQQLITGLAVLILGFSKHCSISSRLFWIVFDLAYFSAVTHLASLPALRSYFYRHLRLRDFRVFLMLCNYIMLLVAAILTFRDYDVSTGSCHVRCTFNRIRTKQLGVSAIYIVQMILLTLVFFWQLVMLYMKEDAWEAREKIIMRGLRGPDYDRGEAKNAYRRVLLNRNRSLGNLTDVQILKDLGKVQATPDLRDFKRRQSHTQGVTNALKLRPLRKRVYAWLGRIENEYEETAGTEPNDPRQEAHHHFAQWVIAMIFTPPSALVWLVILTLWALGVVRLVKDRQGSTNGENTWTFGQVLPMLIVVLPFFTAMEVFQEKGPDEQESTGNKASGKRKELPASPSKEGSQHAIEHACGLSRRNTALV